MTRLGLLMAVTVLLVCRVAFGEETIYAQELEYYFYADGTMKHSSGQFEITYYIDGDTITRTRVYDTNKKEVIPDDTVYRIQRQLSSDPTNGTNGAVLLGKAVIRAVGQPGSDAIEILVIGETFIQSVKSTSDYFVISRLKRIK